MQSIIEITTAAAAAAAALHSVHIIAISIVVAAVVANVVAGDFFDHVVVVTAVLCHYHCDCQSSNCHSSIVCLSLSLSFL